MATEEQVRKSLEAVLVPAVKRSIVGMNLVREVTTSDKKVNVTLASTGLIPGAQDWIKTKTREAIQKLPDVKEVTESLIQAVSAGVS
jgi:metal-sulfur cluster biosynthetic enzyme